MAVAEKRDGCSFVELREELQLPKSSLHRLLRTLEQGGFLSQRSGVYFLGPESGRLAYKIGAALQIDEFPGSVRPVLEWLARETSESIILAVLSSEGDEVTYIDVINSEVPLRFTVPLGNRRPLYAAAAGQAILAFLPADQQQSYIAKTDFVRLTKDTLNGSELSDKLNAIRETGCAFDRNGSFVGASGLSAPCFDRSGNVYCAICVAGPTERIEAAFKRVQDIVLDAGKRISRILGYTGKYPPTS